MIHFICHRCWPAILRAPNVTPHIKNWTALKEINVLPNKENYTCRHVSTNTKNSDVVDVDKETLALDVKHDIEISSDVFGVLDKQFYEKRTSAPENKQPSTPKRTSTEHSEMALRTSSKPHLHAEMSSMREKVPKYKIKLSKTKTRKGPRDWDVFGTLADRISEPGDKQYYFYNAPPETGILNPDPQDVLETHIPHPKNRLSPEEYAKKMKELIKEDKLKDALEMLYVRMLKEDRVKPNKRVYNVLISGCAKVGYMDMAFKLFREMRARGLVPSGATYTGLFNCCSHSPSLEAGLEKATYLRQKMEEKDYLPNTINYHAMIKAFGRCGDLKTAFSLVDDMISGKYAISDETLSFLLMACAQNKDVGFRFAIEAWRKFRRKHIPAAIYSYNLLLRIVRDCGAGRPDLTSQLLSASESPPEPPPPLPLLGSDAEREQKLLAPGQQQDAGFHEQGQRTCPDGIATIGGGKSWEETSIDRMVVKGEPLSLPDLLSPEVSAGPVLALRHLHTSEGRLSALGGPLGFLSRMTKDKLRPDIKTFTLLLECLPSTMEAEETLLQALDHLHVTPDVDFFNILIKRRSYRNDFENAKEVLQMINDRHLLPDIVTFGVLALGCDKWKDALTLLKDMKATGFEPNVEIMGSLIKCGLENLNWWYVIDMLKVTKEKGIAPSELMLNNIENKLEFAKKLALNEEQGKEVPSIFKSDKYKKSFIRFQYYYKEWLKNVKIEHSGDPWISYRPE